MTMRQIVEAMDRLRDSYQLARDHIRVLEDEEYMLRERSANPEHCASIIDEVADDVREYTSSNCGAIQIAEAIAAGRIRHLTINY